MHVSPGEIDVDVDSVQSIKRVDSFVLLAGFIQVEKRDIIRLQKRREMAKRCRVSSR